MSAVLDVRPSGYAEAAALLADVVGAGTRGVWDTLLATLGEAHGMAGTDDAGTAWGDGYDDAFGAVRLASQDLTNAFFQLAALLEQTGINYGGADAASVPGAPPRVMANRWLHMSVRLGDAPSAVGQGDPEPHGWSFLQHAIGMLWPNGHQDRLRACAHAWSTAADRLQSLTGFIGEAAEQVLLQRTPEAQDAFTAVDGMTVHVTDVAASYRRMADACDAYAEHLDQAHHKIISEIKSFIEWSAGIQIAGGLFAVFTAGISEAVAQAGEATEIARAAKAIRAAITTLNGLVFAGREAVAAIGARVLGVAERLQPLLMRSPHEVELQEAARTDVLRPGAPLPSEQPPAPLGGTPQATAVAGLDQANSFPALTVTRGQIEAKYRHASAFGATLPRGRAGFEDFEGRVRAFVADPRNEKIFGRYLGRDLILTFNRRSKLVVLQDLDGAFESGWTMSERQLEYVLKDGVLGGH